MIDLTGSVLSDLPIILLSSAKFAPRTNDFAAKKEINNRLCLDFEFFFSVNFSLADLNWYYDETRSFACSAEICYRMGYPDSC